MADTDAAALPASTTKLAKTYNDTISPKKDPLASAVSMTVALPPCPMSLRELCTFFPNHSQWPDFIIRALRNGWGPRQIAKAQLYARSDLTSDSLHKRDATIRHQVSTAGKKHFANPGWEASKWVAEGGYDVHGLTWMTHAKAFLELYDVGVRGWKVATSQKILGSAAMHATLYQVLEGVVRMPVGTDAGPVTKALEWAKEQGVVFLGKHTTADLPRIIKELGLVAPKEAVESADWDRNGLFRLSFVTDP